MVTGTGQLTLRRLEDHLWESANLFRNKVSNQKDYILALLFFKRASDIYAEVEAKAIAELVQDGVPEDEARDIVSLDPAAWHSIIVPAGYSWENVRNTDEPQLGEALNDALAAIGRANPKQLSGVFERTDFNNKSALPNEDLSTIIDHFHQLGPLTSDHVPADMLGNAYEWLIAKFAATSGKAGGEFYTPAEVGRLCAVVLDPQPGQSVYDPTCGSGGLLLQVLARAQQQHGDRSRSIRLYGQELNPETWAIARMNMVLHGAAEAADIERGDTLRTPAFLDSAGGIRQFDLVIANPPFSSENWGHAWLKASGDPFRRVKHLPPKKYGEMAFVQHMVASIAPTGRMGVVLPNGVFTRGGGELAVRRDLVDEDLIEAIIQLPKDMFYGAGIPACILICNLAKPASRAGRVLFIDASASYERHDTKNVLSQGDIERIRAAYVSDHPENGFSAFGSREDISERRYNLSVRRYVRTLADKSTGPLSLDEALIELTAARSRRMAADRHVDALILQLESEDSDGE